MKTDLLKVSVIVPIYNVGRYIKECLNSILAQSYTNLEIILVDDCSTDDSRSICQEYAVADKRIVLFCNDKNSGVSFSRNRALDIASGEYICMIDGDDWVDSKYIELMVEAIEKNNVDMCVCGYVKEYAGGRNKDAYRITSKPCVETNEEVLNCAMRKSIPFVGYVMAKLYRKKVIELTKLRFDTNISLCEDSLFNYSYLDCIKTCILIEECLYHYRIHSQSTTRTATPSKIKTKIYAFQQALEIAKKYPNSLFYYRINATIFEASIQYINSIYQSGKRMDSGEFQYVFDLAKSSRRKTKLKFISTGALARYFLFLLSPRFAQYILLKKGRDK